MLRLPEYHVNENRILKMVWKLFSNFPSTKEGGKWVIQSKAFFIQLNWKVEFRHNGAQGEVKVVFLGICRVSSCSDVNKFVDTIS